MMRLTGPRHSRRRTWVPLALGAAVLAYLLWPTGGENGAEVVEAAQPQRGSGAQPRVMTAQLGYAKRAGVASVATNLFESHSWFVAPPPPPPQAALPVVPTAPPLPFTFLGSYARGRDPAVFFLVKGDRIFDVRVGDVLDKQYSVDTAENGQLRMTYLPLGIKQSLAVGGTQ